MIRKTLSAGWLKRYIFMLVTGFIAGCILCCAFSHEVISGNKDIITDSIKALKNSSISGSSIFAILLEKRFLIFIALAIFGLSQAGKCLMNLFLLWFGAGSGIFITAFVKLSGIKALLAAVFFFVPQYIIYIPVFGILYCRIYKFQETFSWKNREFKVRKKGFLANPLAEYLVTILLLAVLMFIAVVLEAYVNPFFVKKIVTIL